MKIIFLDIDGVLNNETYYTNGGEGLKEVDSLEEWDQQQFDPRGIALLNELVEETGSKVVISSSWRKNRTVEELQKLFKSVGFKGEIIDKTPILNFKPLKDVEYNYSVPRGCEIKAWMELNKGILGEKISRVRYVILDDDSDMLYWQRNDYLQVDRYIGLTPTLVWKAIQLLNK